MLAHVLDRIKRVFNKDQENRAIREDFKGRYGAFQELLAHNDSALGLMADMEALKFSDYQTLLISNTSALRMIADMEEKQSGEFLFDRQYIDKNLNVIRTKVKTVIDNLNKVSRNKYAELYPRFEAVNKQVEDLLIRKQEIPESPYTIPFEEIAGGWADRVGSKNGNLGEIGNRASLTIPRGFAVTAYAFKQFMDYNHLRDRISEKLAALSIDNLESLNQASSEVRQEIVRGEIPPDLEKEVSEAYHALAHRCGRPVLVAVRSSALGEDGEFSFAGHHDTFLNVPFAMLLERYKQVIASLFNQRAIFYYKTKGFHEYDRVMAVGVLEMIEAAAGGVVYSQDPHDPSQIIVTAVRGSGKILVDGAVTPERYVVLRDGDLTTKEKALSHQKTMLVCNPDGGIREMEVDAALYNTPCLTEKEAQALARCALALERHFGIPQDIEWVLGDDRKLCILQSRPLRILPRHDSKAIPKKIPGYPVLLDSGVIACRGIGFGKAHLVRADDDLMNFPEGAVLVARSTSPKFAMVMNKARAIVTDIGSTTGHVASLSREYRVPTFLDTERATGVIRNGQDLTVDAINGIVYEGEVTELRDYATKATEAIRETHLFKTLEKVLKLITPLKIVDPKDGRFRPEACETFHDLIHFCHEVAMQEVFALTDTPSRSLGETFRFMGGIPFNVYLIDIGDGIQEGVKLPKPEDITSIPFNALYRGLSSLRWPEPRTMDVKGFLGAMAHTATIPEEELMAAGDKSFAFISREYLNLAIRLGYHNSTIEAFASDSVNSNYVRFFFRGGGAAMERRLRRVRLIVEVLKQMDFNVKVSEDVIDALLTKYKQHHVERILEALGKLTVYTKQLDMALTDDPTTDAYIEDFCKNHLYGNE